MNLPATLSAIALIAGALSPISPGAAAPTLSELGAAEFAPAAVLEGETHCVGEVLALDAFDAVADQPAEAAPEPVCFDTREEAAAYIDGITQVASRGVTGSVVLGTVYSDANYGGSTYTLFGSGSCSGVTYGFPSLSGGWDSSISSAKAANSCWVTLYKATSYGGEKINCMPGCPTVGSLNDQVRSIVFRPQGTVG
ncbi:peptidase inhibitor family I36 protein [Agromyces laixinhei]|uniref:peptidase inhibitor family I36 protein n=1 Tax=Agromyces laixinhei TaxID=2585717 RepID=UPI0012EDABBD|nr:peptidase inhibitor family I36 protein [Agromyces laixinhei]